MISFLVYSPKALCRRGGPLTAGVIATGPLDIGGGTETITLDQCDAVELPGHQINGLGSAVELRANAAANAL